MQIVYVLSDDAHIVSLLQIHQRQMGGIGTDLLQLRTALIVKIQNHLWIVGKRLRRGHFLHPVPFPQAACITKREQTTLGADASAA